MAEFTSGRSDWLPQRARWAHLTRSGFPASFPQGRKKKFSFLSYSNKSFIDQSFSTSSRSIKTQKKNLANIRPSWPHIWLITHIYIYCFFFFWQIYNLSSRKLCTSFVLPVLRLTLLRLRRCCVELHYGTHCFSDGIPRLRGKLVNIRPPNQSHSAVRQNTNPGSRITSEWLSDSLNLRACSRA